MKAFDQVPRMLASGGEGLDLGCATSNSHYRGGAESCLVSCLDQDEAF